MNLSKLKVDNWGGGGGEGSAHIFVFTDRKYNRFQKKLVMQNTIYEYCPPPIARANYRFSAVAVVMLGPAFLAVFTLYRIRMVTITT